MITDLVWIQELLLSPRSCYMTFHDQQYTAVEQGRMPKYVIANNYSFGTPPQCLLDLSSVIQVEDRSSSRAVYHVIRLKLKTLFMVWHILMYSVSLIMLLFYFMAQWPLNKDKRQNRNRKSEPYMCDGSLVASVKQCRVAAKNICYDDAVANIRNPVLLDNSNTLDSSNGTNKHTESFQVFLWQHPKLKFFPKLKVVERWRLA